MTAPRWIARVNRSVTNRLLLPLALYVPPYALISHVGRRSGRHYRTPVMAFKRGRHYLIALTYGPTTDWVRNVLAHGGACLVLRGRTVELTAPRLLYDPPGQAMTRPVRLALRLLRVPDYLDLTIVESA